jgi:hypothetical protein
MSYPTPTLVTQNDDDPTFNENMMTRKTTLLENELTLGSWPVLVMWFDGAIRVYIDVLVQV